MSAPLTLPTSPEAWRGSRTATPQAVNAARACGRGAAHCCFLGVSLREDYRAMIGRPQWGQAVTSGRRRMFRGLKFPVPTCQRHPWH